MREDGGKEEEELLKDEEVRSDVLFVWATTWPMGHGHYVAGGIRKGGELIQKRDSAHAFRAVMGTSERPMMTMTTIPLSTSSLPFIAAFI